MDVVKICTIMFAITFSTIFCKKCYLSASHVRDVKVGQTITEHFRFNKSSTQSWAFRTQPGYNLTAKIDLKQLEPGYQRCNEE